MGHELKIPYLGNNYFLFCENSFGVDGKLLGTVYYANLVKIVDIETNRIIGCYDWYMMTRQGKTYIYDRTGKPIELELDMDHFYFSDEPTIIYARDDKGRLVVVGYFIKKFVSEYQTAEGTKVQQYKAVSINDKYGRTVATIEPADWVRSYSGHTFKLEAILDKSSLCHHFFTQPASRELYYELKQAIDKFNPISTVGKILKIELLRRLIEIEIELGMVPDIVLKTSDIKDAYRVLQNTALAKLNDFGDPLIMKIIWKTIAYAHPQFRLYYEAVRRLGFENDIDICKQSLEILKQEFDCIRFIPDVGELNITAQEGFNELTKIILANFLLYNSLSNPQEVISFIQDSFKEEFPLHIITNPIDIIPKTSDVLVDSKFYRDRRNITPFTAAHISALAMKREGYETYIIIGENYKDPTVIGKGVTREPLFEFLVIFKDKVKDQWYAIDICNYILRRGVYGGDFVSEGLYKIRGPQHIEDEMYFEVVYRIDAEELSLIPRSVRHYLRVRDRKFPDQTDFSDMFTSPHVSYFSSFRLREAEFTSYRTWITTEKSISDRNVKIFDDIMKKYNIKVHFNLTDEAEIVRRKSNFVNAILLLPEKFIRRVKEYRFEEVIHSDSLVVVGIDERGKPIWKTIDEAAGEYKKGHQVSQADTRPRTTIHELGHSWEDATPESIKDIFYSISWKEAKQKKKFLIKEENGELFARPYGMTDFREDFATMVEEYVINGGLLRQRARSLMEKGRFELAVKYLFVKYVVFKDFNGDFFEYLISEYPGLSVTEFESALEGKRGQIPPHILKTIENIKGLAFNNIIYGLRDRNIKEDLGYLAVIHQAI